ncbi:MAG: bacteriorhodopsin [Halobacteriales archaeon]
MATAELISYVIGFAGLLVGIGIAVQLIGASDTKGGAFGYLLVIPGFAAIAYLAMAANIGDILIDGYTLPVPRYIDWMVTTPILVGYAGYVAGVKKQWFLTAGVIDAAMIGLGFGAAVLDPPFRWVLFGLSALCHFGLLVVLYGIYPKAAREQHSSRRQLFKTLQNHVGLLWLAYPVVWIVSPLGIGAISGVAVAMIIAFMDTLAKTPYVYFVYTHRHAFSEPQDRTRSGAGNEPTDHVPSPSAAGE